MPAVTFSRFQQEVLALYEPPHRRRATWFKMRKVLQEFGDLPNVRRSSDLTPSAILAWLATHDDRKPITNRSYLNTMRAAVNIAVKLRYLTTSPWVVRKDWITFEDDEEDDDPSIRHHSIDELLLVLAQSDADALTGGWEARRDQAYVYTSLYTGMRKMESLGLKTTDVDLPEDVIFLRSRRRRRLKTKKSARPIGIAPELKPILVRWIPECGSEWLFPGKRRSVPWFHGSPGKKPLDRVKALGLRAGVEGLTIQSFRRSLATHAKRMGMKPMEVTDLLGHGQAATKEWYLEEDLPNIRELARRISFRQFAPIGPAPPAN